MSDLEVSLGEDGPNRPRAITIRDGHTDSSVVMEPADALWLIERLEDAIVAAGDAP